jgi:hypothetical protein
MGDVVGEAVGVGLPAVRDGVGDAVVGLALGVPVARSPVQVVPLRVNGAGTGLLPVHEPLNPKLAVPPVAMAPL